MIYKVKEEVLKKTGTELELEIKIIGEKNNVKKKVIVVQGGTSKEREISLKNLESLLKSN